MNPEVQKSPENKLRKFRMRGVLCREYMPQRVNDAVSEFELKKSIVNSFLSYGGEFRRDKRSAEIVNGPVSQVEHRRRWFDGSNNARKDGGLESGVEKYAGFLDRLRTPRSTGTRRDCQY